MTGEKKEEEKGGISKERRKWRWDHHVYLSWQRFHTSSLNQRSIEQTGIDIPANVGRSFFLLKYFVCYIKCWRMKDKNMWLFCLKVLISFFLEIILINQTGIFFMKNAVVFNRKFAWLDALSCIVLFRIVSVDSIIV